MKRTFLFVLQTPKVDGAILESAKVSLQGIACLTGHHLILYSHKGDQSESILLKNVDSVEKRFLTFFYIFSYRSARNTFNSILFNILS